MSRRFSLCAASPRTLPATVLLGHGKQVLGRSSGCDVPLKDLSVSRRHAEIVLTESGVTVTDLGSRNGTFVEGKRIATCPVSDGQRVRFGSVTFILVGLKGAGEEVDSEVETDRSGNAPEPAQTATPQAGLSPAERRVLDLLVGGFGEKQIAKRLEISQHTVHNHVRAIYRCYAVHSRAELLAHFIDPRGEEAQPPG
jgi:DNA-binding CsgD family transcriptional regulator